MTACALLAAAAFSDQRYSHSPTYQLLVLHSASVVMSPACCSDQPNTCQSSCLCQKVDASALFLVIHRRTLCRQHLSHLEWYWLACNYLHCITGTVGHQYQWNTITKTASSSREHPQQSLADDTIVDIALQELGRVSNRRRARDTNGEVYQSQDIEPRLQLAAMASQCIVILASQSEHEVQTRRLQVVECLGVSHVDEFFCDLKCTSDPDKFTLL